MWWEAYGNILGCRPVVLCCSQGALSNPLMPTVHCIAVKDFLSHLYYVLVCSNVIPLGLTSARGKKEMSYRASAFGIWALLQHGAEGKGKIDCVTVAANVMNLLWTLHDRTLPWHYQDLKTKLRTFCTRLMDSSF